MPTQNMNEYWISNHEINKRVITKEIQCFLGPSAHVRPYSFEGEDGFLIVTPGPCLTDEQIDDICGKSKQAYEKQAAARMRAEKVDPTDKPLKRPLNRPVTVSLATAKEAARQGDRRDSGYSGGKRSPGYRKSSDESRRRDREWDDRRRDRDDRDRR